MEFQVQQLVKRNVNPTSAQQIKEADELDLFAGVHSGLDDPYNVFFRVSDLTSASEQIYFYAYSMGKKKIVMWGIYDSAENEFLIDSACRYHPNNLLSMLNGWKSHAYNFSFSSVRNRIAPRMTQNMAFKDVRKERSLFETFKDHFMVKLIRSGLIDLQSVKTNDNMDELLSYSDKVFDSDYETTLNEVKRHAIAASMDDKYKSFFEGIYSEIDTVDTEELVRKAIKNRYYIPELEEQNPFAFHLIKYIMVNYFILLFSDMEEYRIAKFIVFSDERSTDTRFEKVIKGSFIYEWIVELSKVLRLDNNRRFIVKYAKLLVEFMEARLNRTDLGVIGGPKVGGKEKEILNGVATFFTKFIELSKYSKTSVVDQLNECPMPDQCDLEGEEECGLYEHGSSMFSIHDLT